MSVIRDAAWLAARREAWDALARPSGNPLLEADWILSTVDTIHRARDLRLVAIEGAGRLRAAAALVSRGPFAPWEIAGMSALYEPGGVLYEDESSLVELVDALRRIGRPVLLARLPADGPVIDAVRSAMRRPGLVMVRPTASALAVPTAGAWTDYERTLSSRLTSNVKRLARRAARSHPVRAEVLAPDAAAMPGLLEAFVQVEASGWKGRAASSLRHRPALRAFFERYLARAAAARRVRIGHLWFGDRLVAAEIAIVAHNRWWQLKIAFDDASADLYPGLQLTHANVRHAFDTGLEAYEFLGSAADWQRRWNPVERRLVTLVAYPATVTGTLGLGADVMRHVAGRLGRRVRGR